MAVTILLDTNIIIDREDNAILKGEIQRLSKLLNKPEFQVYVHKNSFKDINNDEDETRRKIILSKLDAYPILKTRYDFQQDADFVKTVGKNDKSNDYVDNSLLYSLFKGEVTFLITNDNGIHKKAKRLELLERVFNISEALNYFKEKIPTSPYNITRGTMDQLDVNDPIFDKLKKDYIEFEEWFKTKQKGKRDCLTYSNPDNSLGAVLIYKKEINGKIDLKDNILPYKNRIKIATMIVTYTGYKIGEFFLKWIIDYALSNNIYEVYLTHFVEGPDDFLVNLIEEYGFILEGFNPRGEAVYTKSINREDCEKKICEEINEKSAIELAKKYYPYFYDGPEVNKFVVPITDEYHEKLFLSKSQQTLLTNEITVSRNTIKKAYLSKTQTAIKEGDILLFYQTHSNQGISEMGIVESSDKDLSIEDIIKTVGKRSVFSQDDLKRFDGKNSVFLFIHSMEFNKIPSKVLIDENHILKASPQTAQGLDHEKYLELKKLIQ